ncbi:sigma-70 family RNA polymerase sigma factor [Bacillus timonensis]|uniref:Sigma-70 family RNA polymerase sigma factor n=1 Tax=Bacillus timonensis TaxID=1033734 RepID=A0A4S3PNE7_9BACI|nr:sigma-70 family RNA polymerase sigma factor [Bacillus timonensis]THE10968.1 sigma-70 family RNA polymerase sigma factor [Bacillus timonensis]
MDIAKEVKKARRGSKSSFEKLIIAHKLLMYRVAKTILTNDEDCADAIQEAIINAYQKIDTLKEPAYFKSWLCRIVLNECYQLLRKKKNVINIGDLFEPQMTEQGYEEVEVEQMLSKLPEEQSQLLKLFHIEGMSILELAQIYEVPENTIKTRLRRAREKMRELWDVKEEGSSWINGKRK